jgi:hypothetical protein
MEKTEDERKEEIVNCAWTIDVKSNAPAVKKCPEHYLR